ncbi:MAG: 4Fe-4S dicluster domain-containing protein [Anaerolineaceae bacterium]|nr:MAG: 4Fe-4S dicluster domain-containing protein [Anaerolineaceae bacterium]
MGEFFTSVYLKDERCMGCINCIKRCPTQAIRVRDGKAFIIKEFCIDCGECIRICPHHAKEATYDSPKIMEQFEYNVALPAPSLYGQFNNLDDVNIVLTAFKRMGFDDVYEVSSAAEIVSELTRKYVAENKDKWPIISTACPTVVRLIQIRFPNLIEHLLPIYAPVDLAAINARKKAMSKTGLSSDKIGIIFISPCPAKVTAVKSPIGTPKSDIDGVLAMKEIYTILLPHMKESMNNVEDICRSGRIGIGWGSSGGEAGALLMENYLAADGIENVIRVLDDLEDQKLEQLEFIELNACSGGCVGGVLTVENPYAAKVKLKRLRKYLPVAGTHFNDNEDNDTFWTEDVPYEPVFKIGNNMHDSIKKMARVEELCEKFPDLDCGSCGAPSCKALAEDIVRGVAKEEDCIHILKDYIHRLSGELSRLDGKR